MCAAMAAQRVWRWSKCTRCSDVVAGRAEPGFAIESRSVDRLLTGGRALDQVFAQAVISWDFRNLSALVVLKDQADPGSTPPATTRIETPVDWRQYRAAERSSLWSLAVRMILRCGLANRRVLKSHAFRLYKIQPFLSRPKSDADSSPPSKRESPELRRNFHSSIR